tara:strand:+ start:3188 stop:4528 length:1341 start_codon:yes stop_codon:yes gene_type:complete
MGKQKLQQKLSQNISTKQIQFLNLLQIPITSLQERIQKELEDNPTLEENEENEEDVFSENNTGSSNFHNTKNDYNLVQIEDKKETLANYLSEQLINLELDDKKTFLINYLINSLDSYGFLSSDLHTISNDLLTQEDITVDEKKLEVCLEILQSFEPIGVGARNLNHCLLLQLEKNYPDEKVALNILKKHYKYFVNKNFDFLLSEYKINENNLKAIYKIIESLNPIPSAGFSKNPNMTIEYITSDFNVTIKNEVPIISATKLKDNGIRISKYYIDLLNNTKDKNTSDFLSEKIEKAKWFKDALIKRESTLLKIVTSIVEYQIKYFASGSEKDLKPMKLSDIAQNVGVDISTISRASNSKYIETHFGAFKIKELFSEAYRKDNGEIISTKEIKTKLLELINNENKSKPFTDDELANLLGKEEYHIARRTTAKYRESLKIPVSRLRKKL